MEVWRLHCEAGPPGCLSPGAWECVVPCQRAGARASARAAQWPLCQQLGPKPGRANLHPLRCAPEMQCQ